MSDVRIPLTVDLGLASSFELDIEVAYGLVPTSMSPVEVRPGIGLGSIVFFQFEACDHLEVPFPPYGEVVFGIHVAPHLPWGTPRLAIFVLNIATTVSEAGQFLSRVHRMPVHPSLVDVTVTAGPVSVEVSDASGSILTMTDLHPSPQFSPTVLEAQVFSLNEGRLWGYPEILDGSLCRHQTPGRALTLHPHPFFKDARLPKNPRSYMQTLGAPGEKVQQVAALPMQVGASRQA